MRSRPSQAAALARSLRLYHGDAGTKARMDALYANFLRPGDLAFDIGAHVGDRVSSFRRLGARVVAVEPQPGPARLIRLLHGRDREVAIIEAAIGDQEGEITLYLNRANPTVSTACAAFVTAAQGAPGWDGQVWDARLRVPCTTIAALITRYGVPAFVKIDVEGWEDRVLAGLHRPLPALSFEFTTIARAVALRCLDRLQALGRYRFNVALGETQQFALADWVEAAAVAAYLEALPTEANSGDVYARAIEGRS